MIVDERTQREDEEDEKAETYHVLKSHLNLNKGFSE